MRKTFKIHGEVWKIFISEISRNSGSENIEILKHFLGSKHRKKNLNNSKHKNRAQKISNKKLSYILTNVNK